MSPKGKAKLARATKIREVVLRILRTLGRWDRLTNGPEVIKYQDPVFLIIFSVQPPVPLAVCKQFDLGPLDQGLYCLEIWEAGNGKVLNLIWNSIGATPEIIAFRRGDLEEVFIPPPPPKWSLSLLGYDFATHVRRQRRAAKIRD